VTFVQKVVYIVTKKYFTTDFGRDTIMMSKYESTWLKKSGAFCVAHWTIGEQRVQHQQFLVHIFHC